MEYHGNRVHQQLLYPNIALNPVVMDTNNHNAEVILRYRKGEKSLSTFMAVETMLQAMDAVSPFVLQGVLQVKAVESSVTNQPKMGLIDKPETTTKTNPNLGNGKQLHQLYY